MSAEQVPPDDSPDGGESSAGSGPTSQEIRHSQVSARVPERVARGVFSTGAVVLQGAHEFILDFLLRMTQPQQVASRVVLPPAVMARFIAALRENLGNYTKNFGPPPQPPQQPRPQQTPAAQQASVQDLYDQLKISDEVMCGAYANAVMIGHTPSEFSFDFITTFFPRSAVASRVYMSAMNVPRFLESLTHSFEQFQRKAAAPPPRPPAPPEDEGG
ncbi:MAG: DUF3467 domain-containing protein [Planctomycetes bacterium]|nr:DUF3467 domain-containing protein [Planctomycetota bacterium]